MITLADNKIAGKKMIAGKKIEDKILKLNWLEEKDIS
jgi:hypothetical protein